jgi:hypothetical protein
MAEDARRPPGGPALIGLIGAGVLVISLFLDWFEVGANGESYSFSGWSALEFGDALICVIFIVALVALLRPGAGGRSTSLTLGIFALVLVGTLAITTTPTLNLITETGSAETDLKVGVFVAIGGALILLFAGVMEHMAPTRRRAPSRPPAA